METCRWLVANRARLNVEDDFGRTPVDMAENNGHDDIASFLRTCINNLEGKRTRTCINNLEGKRTSLESLLIGGWVAMAVVEYWCCLNFKWSH